MGGVSSDGKVAVGENSDGTTSYPARWTKKEGWVQLDTLPGSAASASGDGSVIVGSRFGAEIGDPFTAMIWDEDQGALVLADVLTDAGVSLGDLSPWSAFDVSDDGRVVVGIARDTDGFFQGFVACLP